MRSLLWFALCLMITPDAAIAADATGAATPIGARFCEEVSSSEGRDLLRCPGPAGLDAYLVDDDGRAGVSLGTPDGTFISFGSQSKLGQTMEWRLAGGRPFAGIVRFRIPAEGTEAAPIGDLLAVLKVAEGDRPGCVVAVLDATVNPDARNFARRIADERAAAFVCGSDEAQIVGMSSDWARAIIVPVLD